MSDSPYVSIATQSIPLLWTVSTGSLFFPEGFYWPAEIVYCRVKSQIRRQLSISAASPVYELDNMNQMLTDRFFRHPFFNMVFRVQTRAAQDDPLI